LSDTEKEKYANVEKYKDSIEEFIENNKTEKKYMSVDEILDNISEDENEDKNKEQEELIEFTGSFTQ